MTGQLIIVAVMVYFIMFGSSIKYLREEFSKLILISQDFEFSPVSEYDKIDVLLFFILQSAIYKTYDFKTVEI